MGELTKLLGKIAPWLAAAATGPAGLAGMAIKTVAEALNVSDTDSQALAGALAGANPAQLAELRKADIEFKVRMQELGFKNVADLTRIAAEDRDSARRHNVASGMNKYLFVLSIILLSTSLGCEVAVLFIGYPASIPDLVVGRVLGLMDAVAMMVLAYWYGTTNNSDRKTDMLAGVGK